MENSYSKTELINHEYRLAQTAGILIGFFIVTWMPIYLYIYWFTCCKCPDGDFESDDCKELPYEDWLRYALFIYKRPYKFICANWFDPQFLIALEVVWYNINNETIFMEI